MDKTSNTIIGDIEITGGVNDLEFDISRNKLYASSTDDVIFLANLSNYEVEQVIEVGSHPKDILYSHENDKLYCANYLDNTLTIIDANTFETTTSAMYNRPIQIECSPSDNKLFIRNVCSGVDYGRGSVTVFDCNTETITALVEVYCNAIKYNPLNNHFYAHVLYDNGDLAQRVKTINCSTNEIADIINLGQRQKTRYYCGLQHYE